MGYDIYGGLLERGHCEVHPDVAETYPCSVCLHDKSNSRYGPEPEPCQGCYYVTGQMQDCDGSCTTVPMEQWDYFKHYPEQLPGALASEQHRRTHHVDGAPRDQPRHSDGRFAPIRHTDPGSQVLPG